MAIRDDDGALSRAVEQGDFEMSTKDCVFELIYPEEFDVRSEFEAKERGLLDYVRVRLATGLVYDLCFFTPERLAIEFELTRQAGEMYLAEPSLIVVSEITRTELERTVEALVLTSYFAHRVPQVSD